MKTFKIGDKVRINDRALDYPGAGLARGTVHEVVLVDPWDGVFLPRAGASAPYRAHDNCLYFYFSEVELVEEPAPVPAEGPVRVFKIGDKVRIKDGALDFPDEGLKCGTVHEVVALSEFGGGVFLAAEGATSPFLRHDTCFYFMPGDVELVEEPAPAPASTPDRVRAQHAAERLVALLFACTREEARTDRLLRHAYQAAYRAYRECQKGRVP